MDAETGYTCSSVNLRGTPDLKAGVIEALNPQEHVQILEDAGNMLKVQATRWNPPILGYVLKSAIINNQAGQQVFPKVELGSGISVPSVPSSLPLATFQTWLDSQSESPWLPNDYLDSIKIRTTAFGGSLDPPGNLGSSGGLGCMGERDQSARSHCDSHPG